MSAEARHRRPRTIGVVVLVLIALVALAVIASLSLDQGDTDPIKIDGAGDVRKLVGGIRQLGARLGDDDAPVTIQVFNDMQCTDCADFQLDVIEPLIAEKVRAGEVKLELPWRGPTGTEEERARRDEAIAKRRAAIEDDLARARELLGGKAGD